MNKIQTKIDIRIDKETKKKAQKTLDELGLDLSTGVKLFLKSVIATQSIPFEVRTKNGYTLAQERAMLVETNETLCDVRRGRQKKYRHAREMHKDVLRHV